MVQFTEILSHQSTKAQNLHNTVTSATTEARLFASISGLLLQLCISMRAQCSWWISDGAEIQRMP